MAKARKAKTPKAEAKASEAEAKAREAVAIHLRRGQQAHHRQDVQTRHHRQRRAAQGHHRNETSTSITVEPYGYRSFDRQWIIRDQRVISRPNPSLWPAHSDQQIYLKVPAMSTDGTRSLIAKSPGVIVSFSEAIPDMHYLSGSRAGRVHPLWRDNQSRNANVSPGLLTNLRQPLRPVRNRRRPVRVRRGRRGRIPATPTGSGRTCCSLSTCASR